MITRKTVLQALMVASLAAVLLSGSAFAGVSVVIGSGGYGFDYGPRYGPGSISVWSDNYGYAPGYFDYADPFGSPYGFGYDGGISRFYGAGPQYNYPYGYYYGGRNFDRDHGFRRFDGDRDRDDRRFDRDRDRDDRRFDGDRDRDDRRFDGDRDRDRDRGDRGMFRDRGGDRDRY